MGSASQLLFRGAPWMAHAWQEACKGVREISGSGISRTNPDILRYLESVTNQIGRRPYTYIQKGDTEAVIGNKTGDEIGWCAAFVNWCLEQAGIVGRDHLGPVHWNPAHPNPDKQWAEAIILPKNYFVPGAITLIKPASRGRHHIAFLLYRSGGKIHLLGGNQANMVCVAPYDPADVVRFMWPRRHVMNLAELVQSSFMFSLNLCTSSPLIWSGLNKCSSTQHGIVVMHEGKI